MTESPLQLTSRNKGWRSTIIRWIQGFLRASSRQKTLNVKKKTLFVHGNLCNQRRGKGKEAPPERELGAQLHGDDLISPKHSHVVLIALFNLSSLQAICRDNHTFCFSAELCQQGERRRISVLVHLGCPNKKSHSLGDPDNTYLFLTALEGGHPRSRGHQIWRLESPLLGSHTDISSLCPRMMGGTGSTLESL